MRNRHAVALGALALLLATLPSADAQFSGQIPTGTVLGNTTGGNAPARPVTITTIVPAGANPTAEVSAAAVNGVATTFLRSDGAPALANSGVSAGTYTKITVDAKGRATVGATAACADLSDEGTGCTANGANPSAQVGASAINGAATTYMRSDAAPALADSGVTAATYTLATVTFDAKGRATAASSGVATQRVSLGWDPNIDPNNNIIATLDQASTVASIVGTVHVAVGATATLSVFKAPSGTACASGTVLHSGSFNADGTANTNQTLTLTTTALSSGDRLCVTTSNSANWIAGAGIGSVTVRLTTP